MPMQDSLGNGFVRVLVWSVVNVSLVNIVMPRVWLFLSSHGLGMDAVPEPPIRSAVAFGTWTIFYPTGTSLHLEYKCKC